MQAELREAQKRIRLLEQENEILRRGAAYFTQSQLPELIYPLVLELAADRIPVEVAFRVLGLLEARVPTGAREPVTDRD
ncbi:hypothetical protein JOE58_002644 [Curtobacterium luteum]|uniref:Uncharacterized protein n=1 Tax=Curtobacterium luteum TaxID=33881 RepID=A0A8H9L2T5_9MICO|nr:MULTISPECIES: hypothetical protein [Curtobacterium]MBM7803393.1 hypothetical protein [Curtobacterium luteum]NUU49560.1 hypothetical protein [Curtobacterium luteum]GGL11371.1 hypothetical protein GCM10009769_31850 [Curtobacterium luteum]